MHHLRALALGATFGWWLAREAARRRNRSRAPVPSEFDFLSLMSHELKTPINVIIGYLELLATGIPEPLPPAASAHVRQAHLAARRLGDLVGNMLTWVRLEQRRERVFIERTTAGAVVNDACRSLWEYAEAAGVRLDTDVPDALPLRTDPVKACQALSALVSNGVKFTAAGSVRVTAEPYGSRVRFRVRDTGIGISPDHIPRVFEPYWQLESTVQRSRGGLGLGLAIARRLARLMGGDVTARSVPGQGSEFVLELPGG